MTLLSVNTTEHERPVYIGMTGLTWGLGTVLGPVSTDDIPRVYFRRDCTNPVAFQIVGGAFAVSSVGWRFAFYINRESSSYFALASYVC